MAKGFVQKPELAKYLQESPPPGFFILYAIVRRAVVKAYIGKSAHSLHHRMHESRGHIKGPNGRTVSLIHLAIKKYGVDAFDCYVLDLVPDDEINAAEQNAIAEFKTISPAGYNLESGGEGGKRMHPESKKRLMDTVNEPTFKAMFKTGAEVRNNRPGVQEKRIASLQRTIATNPEVAKRLSEAGKKRMQKRFPPGYISKAKPRERTRNTKEESKEQHRQSLMRTTAKKRAEVAVLAKQTALPYEPSLARRVNGAFYISKDGKTIRRCSARCLKYICDV